MGKKIITIKSDEETRLRKELELRKDAEALRMKRFLDMPDLSRISGNPIHEIVKRILAMPDYKDFDVIEVPEIVPADVSFDLFDFPKDHPARSKSDTYYVDDNNILRTHTTVMWNYYLAREDVKKRMAKNEPVGSFSYGKVYRKDEIDARHMNVFHQFGGWLIAPDDKKKITPQDLKNALTDIATNIFGKTNFRFYDHTFPYTDPSFEMEAEINGQWIEMLGSGMVRKTVLSNLGLEGYHGWAFGFGLERLAIASMQLPDIRLLWSEDERVKKQLKLGRKFVEVSKYPPIVRDISFIVNNDFIPNDYFDFVRETAPGLVEQVELLDKYENEAKFGAGKISYAFRITYRSLERTLTSEEIDGIHKKIEDLTTKIFKGTVR